MRGFGPAYSGLSPAYVSSPAYSSSPRAIAPPPLVAPPLVCGTAPGCLATRSLRASRLSGKRSLGRAGFRIHARAGAYMRLHQRTALSPGNRHAPRSVFAVAASGRLERLGGAASARPPPGATAPLVAPPLVCGTAPGCLATRSLRASRRSLTALGTALSLPKGGRENVRSVAPVSGFTHGLAPTCACTNARRSARETATHLAPFSPLLRPAGSNGSAGPRPLDLRPARPHRLSLRPRLSPVN